MEDRLKWIQIIISILSSIITMVLLLYKNGFKNDLSRERKYYKKIVKPFISYRKQNPQVNISSFLVKRVVGENDYIPPYIFYLMDDKEREDELENVLIYDYLNLYPNKINTVAKFSRQITKGMEYISFLGSLFILSAGTFFLALGLLSVFTQLLQFLKKGNVLNADWDSVVLGIIYFLLSYMLIKYIKGTSTDRYTLSIKKMEKDIKRKTKKKVKKNLEKYFY